MSADDPVTADAAEHAAAWPSWVHEMTSPGGQGYAVLSACRVFAVLAHEQQVSKRRDARDAAVELREWANLIRWAVRWWYEDGRDDESDRLPEVTAFVEYVAFRFARQQPVERQCHS